MGEITARNTLSRLKLLIKLSLLHLVGCLYYCISDARSHKYQILCESFYGLLPHFIEEYNTKKRAGEAWELSNRVTPSLKPRNKNVFSLSIVLPSTSATYCTLRNTVSRAFKLQSAKSYFLKGFQYFWSLVLRPPARPQSEGVRVGQLGVPSRQTLIGSVGHPHT